MATNYTTPLVAAIEGAWGEMQAKHSDLPDVVVTMGSGIMQRGLKLGHFAANVWTRGDDITGEVHELFVGAEGLMLGAEPLMATLLHEASHALAEARGIKDCSRNGRYHNAKFAEIAREMGIEVTHSKELGWSETTLPADTATSYEGAIFALDLAITAYRAGAILAAGDDDEPGKAPTVAPKAPRGGGRASSNNGVSLKCNCGRRIRVSNTVAEMGGITCNICGGEFA
jgi:hypothetical protein